MCSCRWACRLSPAASSPMRSRSSSPIRRSAAGRSAAATPRPRLAALFHPPGRMRAGLGRPCPCRRRAISDVAAGHVGADDRRGQRRELCRCRRSGCSPDPSRAELAAALRFVEAGALASGRSRTHRNLGHRRSTVGAGDSRAAPRSDRACCRGRCALSLCLHAVSGFPTLAASTATMTACCAWCRSAT